MKALILAGGQGTRLYPLTLRTPKCLLPIAGKPNILYIIEELVKSGINEIYVSINDKQLKINDFLIGSKANIIIETHENGKLGSIGGLNYAVGKIASDDLLVIGADNFYKGLNINEFIKTIKSGGASIALYELPHKYMVELFGVAELQNGVIASFQEKPSIADAKSQLGSTMIYGLSKEFIKEKLPEYIKNNFNLDTIGSMWQYFAKKEKLGGHVFKGLWADIGSVRAYVELNNKIMSEMKTSRIDESAVVMDGAKINDNVIIEAGCIIGKNCIIGPNTHLMRDTTIGEGSVINGSVIFENVHIGQKAFITNSVIDGNAKIGDRVRINDYSSIGYKSVISDGSLLIKESSVWPFLKANGMIDGNIVQIEEKNDLTNSKYWSGD